jgi:two-component system, LuxR family, sensor kinase FixL
MEHTPEDSLDRFLAYSGGHRVPVQLAAAVLLIAVAVADWQTGPEPSLGFLYIIPVFLISAFLNGRQIVALAAVCAFLREQFHPHAWDHYAALRLATGFAGFAVTGYFISELERKRREVLLHLLEARRQTRLREEAERQLRVLIETSPLAILTLDNQARVVLANRSAHEMLGFAVGTLTGAHIHPHLPILERLMRTSRPGLELRTTVECKGQRRNGDAFLAHLWLSTMGTESGPALAVVVWDASENLRDREGTGLDSMMDTSRVVIGALSHEIRNLSAAANTVHQALAAALPPEANQDYQTLGHILAGLERLASSGLQLAASRVAVVADLGTVLDEARIVIEPAVREMGGSLEWNVGRDLPLVRADHHSLLQVFLNLARNSQRAIESTGEKRLSVTVAIERHLVVVRFCDSGCGVAHPDGLFRPFQPGAQSAGIGLYVSRAILRSHGGDLHYRPTPAGSCFMMELWPAEETGEA